MDRHLKKTKKKKIAHPVAMLLLFFVILCGACDSKGNDAKTENDAQTEIENTASEEGEDKNFSIEETEEKRVEDGENISGEQDLQMIEVDFKEYFSDVEGCFVLYDCETKGYYLYNESLVNTRVSPYSTFKIVSSLMGLRNGVLTDVNSKMNYSGTTYPVESWNNDLCMKEAFQTSCVWYYRQVVDAVGELKVEDELKQLEYGNCDISEWEGRNINPGEELNGFWLGSSLQISPMEQVNVLRKIFEGESIYTDSEVGILKDIMLYDEANGYSIYGKTGTNQNNEGWYVGFAEKEQHTYYFATYITSGNTKQSATGNTAREIVKNIFGNEYK